MFNIKGEIMFLKKMSFAALVCLLSLTMLAEMASDKNPASILDTALKNKRRLNYKTNTMIEEKGLSAMFKEIF